MLMNEVWERRAGEDLRTGNLLLRVVIFLGLCPRGFLGEFDRISSRADAEMAVTVDGVGEDERGTSSWSM